ncbi:MAG: Asp-tRNA(Asn)/Glu-tRNA(Gln) amidotransferase subunit GatC [Flavobacteriia bacterium]|nr:Asp-tRNA(Asn)/Glu-tRNA(Gln) amidotransferase subunit GatC [Flavobacteriia bacterium]
MKIDKSTVLHIAHLARLEVKEEELNQMQEDLEKITDFMDLLNKVDTTGVEPLIFMTEEINVLREDNAVESITQKDALKNAAHKDSDYFRIPKVKG